jgi:ribosome maturation factor RimP
MEIPAMEMLRRIDELISPTVEDLGFELIRIDLSGQNNLCLQIMAEPLDGRGMTVEDCAKISRAVSAVLDVEDPIKDAFTLEVSSPGLDRPLVKLRDFERFAGYEAKIELTHALDGQRRFRGQLLGIAEDKVRVLAGDEEKQLPHADILRSKLVITDELLKAAQKGGKQ